MTIPTQYKVSYDILTESRTDSFLGSTRSDLQNLQIVVNAPMGPGQAGQIVQAMFGGPNNCRINSAYPIY